MTTYLAPILIDQGYIGATGTTPYRLVTTDQLFSLQNNYNQSFAGLVSHKASLTAIHLNINFDGTQNNGEFPAGGEYPTNIWQLTRLQRNAAGDLNTIYKVGIGAQTAPSGTLDANGNPVPGSSPSDWESTPWKAGEIGNAILEQAYDQLTVRVRNILADNPNAEIALNLAGFSRGGAEAVAFANLLNERGIPGLYEPGKVPINSMALIEPVNKTDSMLDIRWPTNVQNTLVLVAENETRYIMQAMPVGGNAEVIGIPGAHADAGGSFNPQGISAVALKILHDFQQSSGVPIADIPSELQPDWDQMYVHNSGIDNYGNVKWSFTEGNRYYEGGGLGSISVQDMLGRGLRLDPVFEEISGKLNFAAFRKTVSEETINAETGERTTTQDTTIYAKDGITVRSRTFESVSVDTSGKMTGKLVVTYGADADAVQSTALTVLQPGNVSLTTTRDGAGNMLSSTCLQIADDGSSLTTTTYPGGRTEVLVTDDIGAKSSLLVTTPGANNTETIASYSYIDGKPALQSSKAVEYFYEDNGTSRIETVSYANGQVVRSTYGTDGQLFSQENVASPTSTLVKAVSQYGGALIDALSLVRAIQTGNPLPIATSGLRLANALDRMDGRVDLQALASVANVASGVLSILSLEQALQRGDALAAITAGANMVSFAANAYTASLTEQYGGDAIAAIADGNAEAFQFASNIGEALPYLSVVNSLAHGDSIGAAVAVADLVLVNAGVMSVPYIGQAYAVYTIVSSLFNDDDLPEPWGNSSATWSDFNVVASAVGEHGGLETAQGAMNQFIATLTQLATQQQAANLASPIGIVANRLPSLSYRDFTGYALTDIDAVTGVQHNPEVRYDLMGRPYNAPPGTEQSSQSLSERFVRVALARGAIAPLWEAQTAALQTQQGDPQAGLTEEERAGRNGQLATTVTGVEQLWRPVALDLDGNGVQTTGGTKTVAFDVDDSGFLKNTAWLNGGDGFLTLDRNLNGQIDSGRELFSNATLALGARGLGGMRWIDANYDGRLDASDPVWNELRVWRDANGDGVEGTGEKVQLSALGITSLNYTMGTFEQDGQLRQLASPDLAADTSGARTHVVPEGIVVETTEGRISLLVTRVDDRGAVEANRDGITTYEDTETIVSTADLVANDTLGGLPGQGLTVTSVSNFTHGTGYLDGNGFIHYMPEANYYGAADFTYTVQDSIGQSEAATVDITIQNVNDAPTATIDQHMRPIYGYQSVEYDESGNAVYVAPAYEPYTGWDYSTGMPGLHDTPITYEDRDGPNNATIVVSDIDDPSGPFVFDVLQQAQKGEGRVYSDGRVEYINWTSPDTPGTDLDESGGPIEADPFTVRVTDPHGASTTVTVDSQHAGGYNPDVGSGGGGGKPVSIDLDGNGFRFTDVDDSNVFFDINGDGWKNRMAWPSAGDGLLAFDVDGDGKIDQANEISFASYKPDAQTDLEALRAFDTNADGLFSAADERWSKFGIWRDADRDGITGSGEFRSLDDMGVASISLTSDGVFSVIDGQTVHGVGTITMTDASTRQMSDVTLSYSNEVLVPDPNGTSAIIRKAAFSQPGEVLEGTAENDLILGKSADNVIYAYAGDDVVFEDGGNDAIDAGLGNDVIYSGADNDSVIGGDGNDVVFAGRGNDLMLGGDGHDALFGEGGNDIGFGGDGNDLVYGDSGNDVLSGDRGDDQVYGGTGNDALFGSAGDDVLLGMEGYDLLYGGEGNDLLDGGSDDDTMYGGAGDDTYVVDSAIDVISEEQNEGEDTVGTGLSYVLGDNLENLTLTGSENISGAGNALDNVLTGNSGDNALDGEAGNDVLNGGAGADLMTGGAGDDTYVVDNADDVVREYADEGNDTVRASRSYALGDYVENLILTGFGSVDGSGNALDNTLTGNRADNVLDGGAGADTMSGGLGNDTYMVDHVGDRVIEAADAGYDTVRTALSHTLEANVEALVLTGTLSINGTGNELDNTLTGNISSNVLDGGMGADRMAGGAGDDVYVVDAANDIVIERSGEGYDTVYSSVAYILSENVETLTLTGVENIDAAGNEMDNALTGNAGNNAINGGAGADRMAGGAGDDTYDVDQAGDVVVEHAGEGYDTVNAAIGYTLNDNVERLVLTGTADTTGTGNALDNVLVGNAGSNVLDGAEGADTMIGGAGDDTYFVDNTADSIIESADAGYDRVFSSVDYNLEGDVEALILAQGATRGTGNSLDNTITGNDGDNALYGLEGRDVLNGGSGDDLLDGGAGADVLRGGSGDDTYVVDDAADAIAEYFDEGRDVVYSSVSYVLPGYVEELVLNANANIDATGNELDNVLTGNAGDNVLDGRTGVDVMAGGGGDDTYIVDNTADRIVEDAGEGLDTVIATVDHTLAANTEVLILAGAAAEGTGNGLDNTLIGNDLGNRLFGGAGNDELQGGAGSDTLDGGSGADRMAGGTGDDIYQIDDTGDVVTELFGEGHDVVRSQISYVLPSNVEDLRLTGTADLRGAGNDLDNSLWGNAGNNVLDGGAGVDTMAGGAGNDLYVVENSADRIVEAAAEGRDAVISSVSYVLPDSVEDLTLSDAGNTDGTGNASDNAITGNAGGNRLGGLDGNDTLTGGAGDDTLYGGIGNDTYVYNMGDGLDMITDESGLDSVQFGMGLDLANVALRIRTENGVSTAHVRVLDADGCEQADQGFDFTIAKDSYGHITSSIERFVFPDGSVLTWEDLLIKEVTTYGNARTTSITTGRNDDTIIGGPRSETIHAGTGNDIVYGGPGADTVYGEGGDDYLAGGTLNDILDGGCGVNVLDGRQGDDLLTVTGDGSALVGGNGFDILRGAAGADFIAGSKQNDTIEARAGTNVIAFNAADGRDLILPAVDARNTLSLGGNVDTKQLYFRKLGFDLLLEVADDNNVTFRNWYADAASQNFQTLQVFRRPSGQSSARQAPLVDTYDFGTLVAKFDSARAANAAIDRWSVMNGLLDAHLASSDTAAMGGDLAAVYADRGDLSGMNLAAAQDVLKDRQFGAAAQTLRSWGEISNEPVRLL